MLEAIPRSLRVWLAPILVGLAVFPHAGAANVPEPPPIELFITESVGVADSTGPSSSVSTTVKEPLELGAAAAVTSDHAFGLFAGFGVSDGVSLLGALNLGPVEGLDVADDVDVVASPVAGTVEAIRLTDDVGIALSRGLVIAESIGVSDEVEINGDNCATPDDAIGPACSLVVIDIEPNSDKNQVDPTSKDPVAVAILTTAAFDASTVDPDSVCFGDAEAPSERDCTAANPILTDVDGDDDLDRLFVFEADQTGIDPGDVEACLSGTTLAGEGIVGCDRVEVAGGGGDPLPV